MKRLLLILLLLPAIAHGAFTEFYCQSGGSNLNAGSTTSNTATFTYASGSWAAATGVFTVASGNPQSDGVAVGDFASVYADGSTVTGFVGRVTARTTTTITVSLSARSGTAPTDGTNTRTLKIGGAWQGPNGADAFPFGFATGSMTDGGLRPVRINLKNSTVYSVSVALVNSGAWVTAQGYASAPGDGGMATIDASGGAFHILSLTSTGGVVADVVVRNNSGANAGIRWNSLRNRVFRCVAHTIGGSGFFADNSSSDGTIHQSEAYACGISNAAGDGGFRFNSSTRAISCIAHDNVGSNISGFVSNAQGSIVERCISDSNTLDGFSVPVVKNCDAYNNGRDGFRMLSSNWSYFIESSNAVKNGGWGVNASGFVSTLTLFNVGYGSGTQANTSGTSTIATTMMVLDQANEVTYPANVTPWVDPANGDFRINHAAAKGTGRGAFLQTQSGYGGTVGYPDIGAAQHQETGGGRRPQVRTP